MLDCIPSAVCTIMDSVVTRNIQIEKYYTITGPVINDMIIMMPQSRKSYKRIAFLANNYSYTKLLHSDNSIVQCVPYSIIVCRFGMHLRRKKTKSRMTNDKCKTPLNYYRHVVR